MGRVHKKILSGNYIRISHNLESAYCIYLRISDGETNLSLFITFSVFMPKSWNNM